MPTSASDRVLIDVDADDYAFRIGQWFEHSLMDRAMELVGESGLSVVTTENVRACLDRALFDEFLNRIREGHYESKPGEGGAGTGQSREAA